MIKLSGWQIAAVFAAWTSFHARAEIGDMPRAPAPSGQLVQRSGNTQGKSGKASDSSAPGASGTQLSAAELAGVRHELAAFEKAWTARLPEDDSRFGIIRVLSLLNLDHPGLEKVKTAATEHRYADAERELLIHFRKTRSAGDATPRQLDETQRRHANDALQHRFRGNKDVYDDGMNKELVFSYHSMYVGLFMEVWNMFREHGYEDRLPPTFRHKLLKMGEIHAMQSFPDFTICQFGDAWKRSDPGGLFRNNLAPFKEDIPYFDFMASGGKRGIPPTKTNVAYPLSGFYFFRSDWTRDAVFMALKSGATASWHNQPDNGTFELYAYGRNLMNDSGCYVYGSSDPEDQRWREWFRRSRVHQTLTLDKRDLTCAPECVMWSEAENLTALVVENGM
jgi:hypothetical protein